LLGSLLMVILSPPPLVPFAERAPASPKAIWQLQRRSSNGL
jgi:hypothetical protein